MNMTSLSHERRILVVDDDPDSLEIICEALRWDEYQVLKTLSATEAVKSIHDWHPHLVILDVNMPQMDGFKVVKELKGKHRFTSVIFCSADASTDTIISGLDAGADDYITKPFNPLELLARVRTQLRIKDLNDQLIIANDKLKELVDRDDLTGLFNMRSIYDRIQFEIDRARRFGRHMAVVMMDMDFFKTVNDGHDHLFGSYVLSEVGEIIKSTVRSIDIPARYGGDEFLIVITETNSEGAMHFCERLRKKIEGTLFKSGKDQMQLTASLGYAVVSPGDSNITPKELVRIADNALYEAKRAGRNCIRFIENSR